MRDQFDIVPPEIRRMHEADEYNDRVAIRARGISEALTALKPGLELVLCRHDVNPEMIPYDCLPGYWHVRDNSASPVPKHYPITGPNGEFRVPDSHIVRELAEHDMRRADVAERVFGSQTKVAERKRREKALRTEQMNDDFAADIRAGRRVSGRIYGADGQPLKRKVA
jgi:hypothetical protein